MQPAEVSVSPKVCQSWGNTYIVAKYTENTKTIYVGTL